MAEKKVKFSVIIPTHKRSAALERCLSALKREICGNDAWEAIIVYDGEAPTSEEAKIRWDGVRDFSIPHQGPAAARNFGAKMSRGDILIFIDDDVVPTEGWQEATRAAWERFPDASGIGGAIISAATDTFCSKVSADLFNCYIEPDVSSVRHNLLCSCNVGYRKDIFFAVGGFDENFRAPAGEDKDLNIRIQRYGGTLMLERRILVYHDQSCTLASFVGKNFRYGEGAYMVYAKHNSLRLNSPGWYAGLFSGVTKNHQRYQEKAVSLFLLLLAQSATLVGYGWAGLKNKVKF